MSVNLPLLPQGLSSDPQSLVVALNDRLRRISSLGTAGPPGPPGPAAAGGVKKVAVAFVAQTTVVVTHNLGTFDITLTVWDSTGANQILPETAVLTDINTLTLTFGVVVSGTAVVMG